MPHITVEQLLERNRVWATSADHKERPLHGEEVLESGHTIVISCFDPRACPEEFLNIDTWAREVTCIRNAGGHTQHVVSDIVSLDSLLGIRDIMVIHHRDCRLTHTSNQKIRMMLRGFVTEEQKNKIQILENYEIFEFGEMTDDTLASSCREDVQFLQDHPWIHPGIRIEGFVYDIKTGLLEHV